MKFGKTHFDLLDRARTKKFHLIFLWKSRWRMADFRTSSRSIYWKRLDRGKNRHGVDADGMHMGATWRTWLNRPC